MRVLVTGATGFLGRHVIKKLLNNKHEVIALARDEKKAKQFDWYSNVNFICQDIHHERPDLKNWGNPKIVMHLVWSGLPNYQSSYHLDENLPAQMRYLKLLLEQGIEKLLVTGTCLEYGMQYGPLSVNMQTFLNNPYAEAKDSLRKWLQNIQEEKKFILQWVRLFYMYGTGQNPNSVLSQLNKAIKNGEKIFNISGGEQLRDYLHVSQVADQLINIVEDSKKQGILQCCSGKPISIRRLVEQHINKRNANIKLNLGYYPYPDYEPMAFWGEKEK